MMGTKTSQGIPELGWETGIIYCNSNKLNFLFK